MYERAERDDELVVASNFARAIRESGYTSLATALAELIDNSIQAGATEIAISVARTADSSHPEISVRDNGAGMDSTQLGLCLKFGGSSRFNERQSFGRFGMGLPAASLSQARRVEVSAWQDGGDTLEVVLDVDIAAGGGTPLLRVKRLEERRSGSGCLVVWRSCDRIEYRRLGWLERSLRTDLGRMYRRFLGSRLAVTLNGKPLVPQDPMMLDTSLEGASAEVAFEPRTYEFRTVDGSTGSVRVRFAILPVHRWHSMDNISKRRAGIVGGGGVSVLRAGREISMGWHLMGSKRKENYDDWWRCEIEFEPALDEHFGITINKQGIRPSQELRDVLEPDIESIARILGVRVRQSFENLKFQAAAEAACRAAEAADPGLPVIGGHPGHGSEGPLSYRISTSQLAPGRMFATSLRSNLLEVQLNVDHPAFEALYKPLQSLGDGDGANLRTGVELLLLALARSAYSGDPGAVCMLDEWGSTYGRMLQSV